MIDANQTLNQLAAAPNGANRLIAMIGAKNFVKSDTENFVGFRFMRGAANKANFVRITLNAMDTYDVEFIKIHGINIKTISTHHGIYDDMLYNLFTSETGLALKF